MLYLQNLNQNPRTLLPKFFGLYCYVCRGKNVRVCVMNNLLPSFIPLHQKYDLKGSTYKRKASKQEKRKNSPTYKDLDFIEHHPEGISLEAETYNALMKTIQRDCRVLESFKIMDYSLLMGVHNLDQAHRDKQDRLKDKLASVSEESTGGEDTMRPSNAGSGTGLAESQDSDSNIKKSTESFDQEDIQGNNKQQQQGKESRNINLSRSKSINRQRLAAYSTAMESIQAEVEPIDEEDDVP